MAKTYYSLLSLCPGHPWAIEFGDYSRAVVAEEMADMEHANDGARIKFKIVATGDKQADIEAKVAHLNAAIPPAHFLATEYGPELDAFAARYGRGWRDTLYTLWGNGRDYYEPNGAALHRLRNLEHGADFVASYKPAKPAR